jgi:hypothetical protein
VADQVAEHRPGAFRRILQGLPLAIVSPFLLALAAVSMACCDLIALFRSRRPFPMDTQPATSAASIVIPNWNGRDLLEKYLPSVRAAALRLPGSEVIVVDNGSTDGSAAFVRERFPEVRILALPQNLGFGGGSNAGFRAAKNDIVVLLNSDMRVAEDFYDLWLRQQVTVEEALRAIRRALASQGKLKEGVTATDLVLTITERLRKHGVVGKFVEFFGPGLAHLTIADRATLGNMCPEYGATIAVFPIDAMTIDYLRLSGRDAERIELVWG